MSIDERLAEVYKRTEKIQDSMGRIVTIEAIRELEKRVAALEMVAQRIDSILGPQLTLIKGGLETSESD